MWEAIGRVQEETCHNSSAYMNSAGGVRHLWSCLSDRYQFAEGPVVNTQTLNSAGVQAILKVKCLVSGIKKN